MVDSVARSARAKRVRWTGIVVLVLVLAGAYLVLTRQDMPAQLGGFGRDLKTPVSVAAVTSGEVSRNLSAIGTVTATSTVIVQPKVDGELISIEFSDGQMVHAGDVLAQIDPRSYQIQLDQAQGQQMQNAAQLANAKRDLARYEQLYKQNSIARQQVDTQRAQVFQFQGQAKTDQAAVDDAQLRLDYTRITAPIDGRLGLRKVDVGNYVRASDAEGLIVITRSHPIDVVFAIPQASLLDVLARQKSTSELKVDVLGRDGTTKLATGTLIAIDNQIDVATGTVQLKARFANEENTLFPNQFVNVRLDLGQAQGLLVPVRAVQLSSTGEFVYRVDDEQRTHVVQITTGVTDGEQTVVLDGLAAGQRVVVDGTDRLREGSVVEVVDQGSAS